MKWSKKGLTDVCFAVAITASLTLYHISVQPRIGITGVEGLSWMGTSSAWIAHVLYFWTLSLLWVAFRRWRGSKAREREIDAILAIGNHEAIVVTDARHEILRCSDAVTHVFGYEPGELVGKPISLLYGETALGRQHVGTAEVAGRHKDGRSLVLDVVAGPLPGGEGMVVMIDDITQRKERETKHAATMSALRAETTAKDEALTALSDQYAHLRSLEQSRNDLTHMIIHDLRTPLQVITLKAELLRMQQSGKRREEVEVLDGIIAQARAMEVMIRSVLDVGKSEKGAISLRRATCDMRELGERVMGLVRPLAHHVTVSLRNDAGAASVVCDPDLIQRVFVNLLVNAFKYAPDGTDVLIRLALRDAHVVVEVRDEGPGILPEYRERIFEKYGVVPGATHYRSDSTGLGLTFCRLAVEAHGGTIGVDSEPGKGSAFWFSLPLAFTALDGVTVGESALA